MSNKITNNCNNSNNSNNNSIYSEEKWNSIFKSVWRNVVLLRLILNYTRLLNKNKVVEFKTLKSLQEYQEKEFIEKLIYKGNDLINGGDLPRNSFLKELVLENQNLFQTKGFVIPYGVEVLQYYSIKTVKVKNTTPFSELPTSIHTIRNVLISNVEDIGIGYVIPSNIKSISFIQCPNISGEKGSIILPNTIQELILPYSFNNDGFLLRENDLPSSLTSLTYFNLCGDNHLKITVEESAEKFKLLAPLVNLQSLKFRISVEKLLPNTLSKYCSQSLKKLTLCYLNRTTIEPNSIPSSVTDLTLDNIFFKVEKDIFPHNIKTLSLSFYDDSLDLEDEEAVGMENRDRFSPGCLPNTIETLTLGNFSEFDNPIYQDGVFPSSLTHLIFTNELFTDHCNTMLSFIPSSVHTITIPKEITKFNIPSHIKVNLQ